MLKALVQGGLELRDRPIEGPEAQRRQSAPLQDGVGLSGQLLTTREIAAVAHVHVGHQPMGLLTRQQPQPLQPEGSGGGGGAAGQGGELGQVVIQGAAACQLGPGHGGGAKGAGQGGSLPLEQGIGRGHGPQQGGQLQGRGLTGQQGAGEGHAFGLVMGLADPGMEPAHPRAEAPAQVGIGGAGVVGDRGGRSGGAGEGGGGHGVNGNRTTALLAMGPGARPGAGPQTSLADFYIVSRYRDEAITDSPCWPPSAG